MSSRFWFFAVGSRDLSQAEREITASKAEQKQNMATIFTQNDKLNYTQTYLVTLYI